jgi:tRNA (guanine-N7-)-methyltransferase
MTKRTLKDYENVALSDDNIKGKLKLSDVFGRKNSVHIEVGSGKGTFLVGQAAAFPNINFLGIEWANKYYKYAVDRMGRRGLGNVRMLRTDAAVFIAKHIRSSSVQCFHIYFPDPWPKRAHHKRRFISQENVTQLIRCLKKNGLINIATDHEDYFHWMQNVFANFTNELTPVEFMKPVGAKENEYVGTNFERKYMKEKRNTYTLAFKKG